MSPAVFIGPSMIVIPGLIALLWAVSALRRATASRRWTPVPGTIVAHERDAHGPVDVVEYPLPEGGVRQVRPAAHGRYGSGRPIGTRVTVLRDPVDALNAVLEPPGAESYAAPMLVAILGGFFLGCGLVWAALILALVSR